MRRPALALALALLAPMTLAGPDGRAPDDGPDDVKGGVRALLDRQVADWNRKDLDAFASGYWRSPGLVFLSGGDRSEGWDAMRERYRKGYQAEGKEMGTLAFQGVDVVPLGPDVALARGRWGLTKADGSAPGGLFTLVLKKLPEGWRIIHDHTSSAAPK